MIKSYYSKGGEEMELFEVLNPVFEDSLKINNSKIKLSNNNGKTQCFSSFINEAINKGKYDKKTNSLIKNSIKQYNNSLNKLDAANKVNEDDKIEVSNLFNNNNLITKTKEKADVINEQINSEETELKNEDLKRMFQLIYDFLNLDGANIIYVQQILKIFESNSFDMGAFDNDLNNGSEMILNSLALPKIETIKKAISFLGSLLNEYEDGKDVKSFIDSIPDNHRIKELLVGSIKSIEGEPLQSIVFQKTDNELSQMEVNLNSNTTNLENEDVNREVNSNKSMPKSEKAISVFEGDLKKPHWIESKEPGKESIKDLESKLLIFDEKNTIIFDAGKIHQKKPEALMKQQILQNNHILEQIIDKAKFITKKGFSELKIQLKPESLGKLTLNLILDKGVMTARFVTENNVVKEVIESNFSELRDALQEKGIDIQNLSVSVGQDGRWFNDKNGFRAWKKSINQSGYKKTDDLEQINPYNFKEGTLDIKV